MLGWNPEAGAPSCYLELVDKLQNWICRTVGLSLAAFLEPWAHCPNVASFSLFYKYCLGRCSSELAQVVAIPYSQGSLLAILIDCMIFLSPFLNVTRMSMSTVSTVPKPLYRHLKSCWDTTVGTTHSFCNEKEVLWYMEVPANLGITDPEINAA